MNHTPVRRRLVLFIAAALLLALAGWQWLDFGGKDHSALTPGRGISRIEWDENTLTLGGLAEAQAKVSVQVGEQNFPALVDDTGAFTVSLTAEQKSPMRANLLINDDTYNLIMLRLSSRWAVLQRHTHGGAASTNSARAWVPAAGLYDDAPTSGILTLTKDSAGFAAALALPQDSTTYVYASQRLAAVVRTGAVSSAQTIGLPDAGQMRLDIYDAKNILLQRLRLTLPPAESAARYDLNDGELWVFNDFSAQRGEVDETYAGQFIPVSDAATAATPQDTGAPAGQNAPAE